MRAAGGLRPPPHPQPSFRVFAALPPPTSATHIPLGHEFFPLFHGVLAPGGQHGARRRPHKGARGGDPPSAWKLVRSPGWSLLGVASAEIWARPFRLTAQDTSAEHACTLEASALASPGREIALLRATRRMSRSPFLVPETEGRPPGLQGLASGER